ncbi:tetratricopeptide repeat protein [Faecalibacter rhinopitheci]|uniref:Tetratricopeptide repeat protein n=1 Tax=Faecalibacter rhinopitheci TaxID=2779678 RepID=A0A8J7FUQ6_9FLAO|nr:tetratricopeptide repeat protein [Faecalibacter rhinopitheci]MBF0598167.1 tetratricopeptide repeat protein [Faecalibacter rhinopitheci]
MKLKLTLIIGLISVITIFGNNPNKLLYNKALDNLFKNPDYSLQLAQKLLKLDSDPNNQAKYYILSSTAYIAKRDFEASLNENLKAKALLNEISDHSVRSNVLLNIAIQYQQIELFSKSFETLKDAESEIEHMQDNQKIKFSILGKIDAVRGMIYKSQSNPELALEKFFNAVNNLKNNQADPTTQSNLSVVYYNIGYCYLDMQDKHNAEKYYQESLKYAKKIKAKSLEAFALKGLAEVYFVDRNYEKALEVLNEAESLATHIGDLVLNEGIYLAKAENYLVLNNFSSYKKYNEKYIDTFYKRQQSEIQSISSAIDHQVTINKESNQKLISKHQKVNYTILVIGGVMMIIMFYLMIKFNKKRISIQNQLKSISTK